MINLMTLILYQAGVGYEQNWSTEDVPKDLGDVIWYVMLTFFTILAGIIWYKVKYDK